MKDAHGESAGVARQILLLPEVVELDEAAVARLTARAEELAELGLVLEALRPRRGGRARDARRCSARSMCEAWCAISPTRSPSSARRSR